MKRDDLKKVRSALRSSLRMVQRIKDDIDWSRVMDEEAEMKAYYYQKAKLTTAIRLVEEDLGIGISWE